MGRAVPGRRSAGGMMLAIVGYGHLRALDNVVDWSMRAGRYDVKRGMLCRWRNRHVERAAKVIIWHMVGPRYIRDGHPGTDDAHIFLPGKHMMLLKILHRLHGLKRGKYCT